MSQYEPSRSESSQGSCGGRPAAVGAIAVLLAISGLASLVGASGALLTEWIFAVDFVTLAIGPVLLFIGWGIWRLKQWAWLSALIVVGFDLLLSMYTLFNVPRETGPLITLTAWIGIFLALIIVYLLGRPDVQASFGHRPPL